MTLTGYAWTMALAFCLLVWSVGLSFVFDHAFLQTVIVLSSVYLGFMVCPAYRKYKHECTKK